MIYFQGYVYILYICIFNHYVFINIKNILIYCKTLEKERLSILLAKNTAVLDLLQSWFCVRVGLTRRNSPKII